MVLIAWTCGWICWTYNSNEKWCFFFLLIIRDDFKTIVTLVTGIISLSISVRLCLGKLLAGRKTVFEDINFFTCFHCGDGIRNVFSLFCKTSIPTGYLFHNVFGVKYRMSLACSSALWCYHVIYILHLFLVWSRIHLSNIPPWNFSLTQSCLYIPEWY